jgi:hypothetical protein
VYDVATLLLHVEPPSPDVIAFRAIPEGPQYITTTPEVTVTTAPALLASVEPKLWSLFSLHVHEEGVVHFHTSR